MDSFMYASSTVTLDPSSKLSCDPYKPFQDGPIIVVPSILWHATHPLLTDSSCPDAAPVPDEDESVDSAGSATGASVGASVGADVAVGAGALVAAGSVAFVGTVVLSPPHAKDDTTITNNKLDKIKILFTYPPIKAQSILNEQ